jgi:hypothetical protein
MYKCEPCAYSTDIKAYFAKHSTTKKHIAHVESAKLADTVKPTKLMKGKTVEPAKLIKGKTVEPAKSSKGKTIESTNAVKPAKSSKKKTPTKDKPVKSSKDETDKKVDPIKSVKSDKPVEDSPDSDSDSDSDSNPELPPDMLREALVQVATQRLANAYMEASKRDIIEREANKKAKFRRDALEKPDLVKAREYTLSLTDDAARVIAQDPTFNPKAPPPRKNGNEHVSDIRIFVSARSDQDKSPLITKPDPNDPDTDQFEVTEEMEEKFRFILDNFRDGPTYDELMSAKPTPKENHMIRKYPLGVAISKIIKSRCVKGRCLSERPMHGLDLDNPVMILRLMGTDKRPTWYHDVNGNILLSLAMNKIVEARYMYGDEDTMSDGDTESESDTDTDVDSDIE